MPSKGITYYKADWVIPMVRKPIKNGVVGIENNTIAFVGKEKDVPHGKTIIELKGIILPGLINAHTHLEDAVLHGAIPPQKDLYEWQMMLGQKKNRFEMDDIESAVRFMLQKFHFEGISAVGDFLKDPLLLRTNYTEHLIGKAFLEVNGTHTIIGVQQLRAAQNISTEYSLSQCGIMLGLNNASYANKSFLKLLKSWQLNSDIERIISIHCCEFEDEIVFFLSGKGAFGDYLSSLGFLEDSWQPPGKRPIAYLNEFGLINENTILINPIFISDQEINLLGLRKSYVCWTPISNIWMKTGRVPVLNLMKKGVTVCLGTDSPAKNPYMSMWIEMQEANMQFPELLSEEILKMATINGARALKVEHWLGSIMPGKMDKVGILMSDLKINREQDLYDFVVQEGYKYEWYWLNEIKEMLGEKDG